ncbi:MAG TPA: AI-2E family transporter [Candidatus Limnocylindrales bacterium]|jgi:predicted PurR-regulated permease PerM|nr:AI-2E family transporter [Candidatus Limnocylindrales bacterium]
MRGEFLAWMIRGAALAVGVAFVLALAALGAAAGRVLLLVFMAVLLASALEPMIGWIRGHLGLGRGATILLVYAGFFLTVVGLTLVVVPAAVTQFNDIVAGLPPLVERAHEWASSLRPRALSTSISALIDEAEKVLRPIPPDPDAVIEVGVTVAEAVVSVATILAIVFFWLTEHARLQRFALAFLPARRRAGAREAWNEVETRLGLWVRGQLILMGTIGLATGVAYTLLGLPSALLLALVAAVTEAIPIVGPLLGAIPAVLVGATVSPELALTVAVIYVVLHVVEGNVLVPLVMRNTIGISPFLVIVSVLVGAAAGGVLGALFAVPVAAAIVVVLERLQAREVPVAQDPGGGESAEPEEAEGPRRSLPDGAAADPQVRGAARPRRSSARAAGGAGDRPAGPAAASPGPGRPTSPLPPG